MADRRKPYNPLLKSYPDSEKVNSCSEGAETLFTRLIAQSDDENHYYGDAAMILGKLYTRRMALGQVDLGMVQGRIDELIVARLIYRYEINGQSFVEIINCHKDLRADVKRDIRFPMREQTISVSSTSRIRDASEPNSALQTNRTEPNRTEPKPENPLSAAADVRGIDDLPPGFVRFWSVYPKTFRKQGRSKCLQHWRKHKLEKIADQVVAALQHCARSDQWMREGGQYVPFPMTWLNRTPWETDLSEMREAAQKGTHGTGGNYAKPKPTRPLPIITGD